eukprot:1733597-Amphidinium_carterae.1
MRSHESCGPDIKPPTGTIPVVALHKVTHVSPQRAALAVQPLGKAVLPFSCHLAHIMEAQCEVAVPVLLSSPH